MHALQIDWDDVVRGTHTSRYYSGIGLLDVLFWIDIGRGYAFTHRVAMMADPCAKNGVVHEMKKRKDRSKSGLWSHTDTSPMMRKSTVDWGCSGRVMRRKIKDHSLAQVRQLFTLHNNRTTAQPCAVQRRATRATRATHYRAQELYASTLYFKRRYKVRYSDSSWYEYYCKLTIAEHALIYRVRVERCEHEGALHTLITAREIIKTREWKAMLDCSDDPMIHEKIKANLCNRARTAFNRSRAVQ